jgi:glycosyltransferase involved in cell wall biosynthesis
MAKTNLHQTGLSIIIPHYNRPWCLEIAIATLQRALSKCKFPYEFIVADDGSVAELDKFLDQLPVNQVFRTKPRDLESGESTTIYRTIWEAYNLARYPYLLHVEDDFWFVPQGFNDQGKNHIGGLLASTDFTSVKNPFQGAIELLQERSEIHFIELARGFNNKRYPSIPDSEKVYSGIAFRTKRHYADDIWYICAWPHIGRTAEILSIPMPFDAPLWKGEQEMMRQRCLFFGDGDWVCNPELSYFAHINIFSWRQMQKPYKHRPDGDEVIWTECQNSAFLPYKFVEIENFNSLLLNAFIEGKIGNKLNNYFISSPMEYIHDFLYKEVYP